MVLDKPLQGKFVNLRSVTEDDAEFILQIRNDPDISKYLPPLNITVAQQRDWIRKQRSDSDSYYFVIERKTGEKIGTNSIYNICNGIAEGGRFCSIGYAHENVEAKILLCDYMFGVLGIDVDEVWVYEGNKEILSLNRKFGAVFYRKDKMVDNREVLFGCITSKNYFRSICKIREVLYSLF